MAKFNPDTQRIEASEEYRCPACGKSQTTGTQPFKCPKCDGTGALCFDPACPPTSDTYTGSNSSYPCDQCGATGIIWG